MDYRKIIKAYKKNGISCLPVDSNKQPLVSWTKFQSRLPEDWEIDKYFADCWGFGVLTGGKGEIETLDIDSKYDLTGNLVENFKKAIPKSILKKLLVQTTKNKGWHFIYRWKGHEGNQKLANRPTTDDEKKETYEECLKAGKPIDECFRAGLNDKVRVILETRGSRNETTCGGYYVSYPSPDYTHVYGKLQYLEVEERNQLIEIARSFNTYHPEAKSYEAVKVGNNLGNSVWEDANNRLDALSLLLEHGWEIVEHKGKDYRLKRPGSTHSNSSALFDADTNLLFVFTSSTVFRANEGYNPSAVFTELVCDGNVKEAYKQLSLLGYGD